MAILIKKGSLKIKVKIPLQFINVMIFLVFIGPFVISYFNEKGFQEKIEKMTKKDITLHIALNDIYAQGLQAGQITRNIFINPKYDQANKNYQKADQKFIKSNEEAIKLTEVEMQDQLKKIQQLWQKDPIMKIEIQQLAEPGKNDKAVNKIVEDTKAWREIQDIDDKIRNIQSKYEALVNAMNKSSSKA